MTQLSLGSFCSVFYHQPQPNMVYHRHSGLSKGYGIIGFKTSNSAIWKIYLENAAINKDSFVVLFFRSCFSFSHFIFQAQKQSNGSYIIWNKNNLDLNSGSSPINYVSFEVSIQSSIYDLLNTKDLLNTLFCSILIRLLTIKQ